VAGTQIAGKSLRYKQLELLVKSKKPRRNVMNLFLNGAFQKIIGILPDPSYTEATNRAIYALRDTSHFEWYLVPFLAFVIYVYFTEIERKRWDLVMAGLAFYGLEWFFEILSAIFLKVHGTSAIWTAPADSAFIITVGLNIEISMMFAVTGLIFAKILPKDKKMKILGIPNRWFFAITNSIFCVFIEIVLNRWDALIWEYNWWNWYNPIFIIIFGYSLYMFFAFWVHDMESMKKRIVVVSTMWSIVAVSLIVFMGILKWI